MKSIKKSMSYKGVSFELSFDVNKIIDEIKAKYRAAFFTLKAMVRSRERYIRRIHDAIRNRDHQMRMFTVSATIYEKAFKAYKLKPFEYDVLNYMYDVEHTNQERISNYVQSTGGREIKWWTPKRLVKLGYAMESDRDGYYYISDKGKQIIESIVAAIRQDMKYYFNNRMRKKNISNFVLKDRPLGEKKYSEEEIDRRRKQYIIFMQPYWDMGRKKIPADPFIRYSMLRKWMEDKQAKGEYVDPVYDRYIVNVQAKMAKTK